MTAKHTGLFTNPYLLLTLTVLFWSGNMVVGRAWTLELTKQF